MLKLYWQLEQYEKANELIMVVKGVGIRAAQKIDVAKVLLQPFHRRGVGATPPLFSKETIAQLQEQGVRLLEDYLSTETRDPNDEILARYELARYFVKRDQITEALQALEMGEVKPSSRNSTAAMYYSQILKMKAELTEKLTDVKGVR